MTPKFMHAMTAKTIGAKRVRALLRDNPYLEQRAARLSDLDRNLSTLARMDDDQACNVMVRMLEPFLETSVSSVPTPIVPSRVGVPPAAAPTLEPEVQMIAVEPIPALESKPSATSRPIMKNQNGETREKILDLIAKHDDGITSKALATEFGIRDNAVHVHLKLLLASNQIRRFGQGSGGKPYWYQITNRPRPTRTPEDIQSAYSNLPVVTKPTLEEVQAVFNEPVPVAIPETRESPVVTDPYDTVLDDLELEIHALKTIITVLRPLERSVCDRVIQYATGRYKVLA